MSVAKVLAKLRPWQLVLISLTAAFGLLIPCGASAAPGTLSSLPRLTARVGAIKGSMKVSWQINKAFAALPTSQLEIWRYDYPNVPPLTLIPSSIQLYEKPAARGSFVEAVPKGLYLYQARLFVAGVTEPAWTSAFWVGDAVPTHGGQGCPANWATDVLKGINEARAAAHLPNLSASVQLNRAAQTHNDYRVDYTSAYGVDPGHTGWSQFMRDAGYSGGWLGENIAWGYPSADSVVAGWMASVPHRENILRSNFRDHGIGCGALQGADRKGNLRGLLFWTEDFGG